MPSLMKMMAEFGLNISPFQAGMKQAEKSAQRGMESIGHHIKGLVAGYFGFEALKHAFADVAERAVRIGQLSKQFSVTTDEVQKLGAAAEHVGMDFESMGAGLDKLGAAREQAAAGNERLLYIFNKLGIGEMAVDLEKISNLDLAKSIGAAFSKMEVTAETREFLRELMGRGGPRLMEVLKGIEHTDHETLISRQDIENIHEAEIALKQLRREWDALIAPKISTAVDIAKHTIGSKAFWWDLFQGTAATRDQNPFDDQDKHRDNALERGLTKAQKAKELLDKAAHLKAHPEDAGIIDTLFHTDAELGAGSGAGGTVKSPRQITEALRAQFQLSERIEAIAFARANNTGRVQILQGKINESHAAELRLKEQLNNQLITQEEYERHIAEQKLDQLNYDQQIYELRKRSALGYEGFRKVAAASGFNPATFGQTATQGTTAHPLTPLGVQISRDLQWLNKIMKDFTDKKIVLGH